MVPNFYETLKFSNGIPVSINRLSKSWSFSNDFSPTSQTLEEMWLT